MAKQKSAVNPFYVLLVILGVVFFVTASAYGVMALKSIKGKPQLDAEQSGADLLKFLDEHGKTTLVVELALLAIATFGAMSTDQYWQNRADKAKSSVTLPTDGPPSNDRQP